MGQKFEEIIGAVVSAAQKYARMYNDCEVWELVNEVWLSGRAMEAPNPQFMHKVIHWDIQDYLRRRHNSRKRERAGIDTDLSIDSLIEDFEWELAVYLDMGQDYVDQKDFIDNLLDGLGKESILIVKLRYYENLNMMEIGKVIGVCPSRICQKHSLILKILRDKLGVVVCK